MIGLIAVLIVEVMNSVEIEIQLRNRVHHLCPCSMNSLEWGEYNLNMRFGRTRQIIDVAIRCKPKLGIRKRSRTAFIIKLQIYFRQIISIKANENKFIQDMNEPIGALDEMYSITLIVWIFENAEFNFMLHRKTTLRHQKLAEDGCFTNQSQPSNYSEGVQDTTTLSRLTFSDQFRLIIRKNKSTSKSISKKKVHTDPQLAQVLPELKNKRSFKLDYLRSNLSPSFSSYILSEEPTTKGAGYAMREQKDDWIIKRKACLLKHRIYAEESKKVQQQLQYIDRIKNRLKIVQDIKKQKRNLILSYLN